MHDSLKTTQNYTFFSYCKVTTFNHLQKKTTQNMAKEAQRAQHILTVGKLLTQITHMIKNLTQRAS